MLAPGIPPVRTKLCKEDMMNSMRETAERFFEACETGKGWAVCSAYCHPEATFSAQTDTLSGISTLDAYTEFMRGIMTPLPDARYEIRSFAVDEARNNVIAYAVFRGTHSGDGGPVPPTGRSVESDYVYVMEFKDGCISHVTKIWHDLIGLRQLGWA
jgi:predicted ester cyclase